LIETDSVRLWRRCGKVKATRMWVMPVLLKDVMVLVCLPIIFQATLFIIH